MTSSSLLFELAHLFSTEARRQRDPLERRRLTSTANEIHACAVALRQEETQTWEGPETVRFPSPKSLAAPAGDEAGSDGTLSSVSTLA